MSSTAAVTLRRGSIFVVLSCSLALPAQQRIASVSSATSVPARSWAVDACAAEIAIIHHTGSYLRYHQHSIDSKGDELRDVIESEDGTVARLIMRDNRPLTAEEDQAEHDRLNGLIEHPSEFARHINKDASGKKTATDLIHLMPDAMIYTYAPDQTPAPDTDEPQVVIDYAPNPRFNPPTTISAALSGLRGRAWIDTRSKTIVRMDGEIFQGINFGWGMLAHIYPGGKVDVEQATAVEGRWNVIHFHEHVTAKALMVKTITINGRNPRARFYAAATCHELSGCNPSFARYAITESLM